MNQNSERKERSDALTTISVDCSVDDFIKELLIQKKNYEITGKYIRFDVEMLGQEYDYSDNKYFTLMGVRYENDEEFNNRIKQAKEVENWQRNQYEALKRKFEK